MLENLSQRLARVVKTMRGEARLTEANTQEMLREVRVALLEADVALPVVREFIARVKEKALGEDVVGSLSPGQALVGVVQRELTAIIGGDLGPEASALKLAVTPPMVILMAGLQGAGKTTTVAKLGRYLREQHKKKVLVVSTDVYRPAAIEQLRTVASQVGIDFFASDLSQQPVAIATAAIDWAKKHYHDVLIVDTAGRLAINTARAFGDALPLTGVVLTKLDGDARGGAALSVRHVTGKPIKFVGVGEKLHALEVFYPERMASRILGMGDIVALVEEAQRGVDTVAAEKLAKKVKSGARFDLDDFRSQLQQMNKMGGLGGLLDKLPAQFQAAAGKTDMGKAEREVRRMEGIINSMTRAERAKPELIKASRKRRIATGAGVPVQEVNRLLKQYDQMQGVMKTMQKGSMAKLTRGMRGVMPGI